MADRDSAPREDDVANETFEPVEGAGTFSLTLLDETKPTVDGRYFVPGAVTWREPPIPLLFTRTNGNGHKGAQVGGAITSIRREDGKIIGEGHFASDEHGQELRQLIKEGVMTGVSADVGGAKVELEADEEGNQKQKISEGRILGVTALPLQAYDDARIAVTAAAVPVEPPRSWFENPRFKKPTPITVTADGQVFGHAALWGTCHVGHRNECLTAPRSSSQYAHFTIGSVLCEDGTQVATGPITLGTGHAGLSLDANATREHYDNSGTAVADVAAGEDEFGIWVAGSVRPGTPPERIREFRGSTLSGDWRPFGHNLELVGLLAVNVPGFPVPRVTAEFANGEPVALVAAGVFADELDDVELDAEEDDEEEAQGVESMATEELDCGCGKPKRPRVTPDMVEALAAKVEMLAMALGATPDTIELSVEMESEIEETTKFGSLIEEFAKRGFKPASHWCMHCGHTTSGKPSKCPNCGRKGMLPQSGSKSHGKVADPTGSYPFAANGIEEYSRSNLTSGRGGSRPQPRCGYCGKSMKGMSWEKSGKHLADHKAAGHKVMLSRHTGGVIELDWKKWNEEHRGEEGKARRGRGTCPECETTVDEDGYCDSPGCKNEGKHVDLAAEGTEEFRNPYAGQQPRDDHGRFAKSGGLHSLTERYAGQSEKRLSQKAKRMGELNKLAKRVHEKLKGQEPGVVLDRAMKHHSERQAAYARTHAPGRVSAEEKSSAKPSLSLIVNKHTKSTGSEVEAHRHAATAHRAVRRAAPSVQGHEASGRPSLKAVVDKHAEPAGGYKMSKARLAEERAKQERKANREKPVPARERRNAFYSRVTDSGVDSRKPGHNLTHDERMALARHDLAREDGSYPIRHEEDLKHAVSLARMPSQAGARSWILQKAKEMNATHLVPAEWGGRQKAAA